MKTTQKSPLFALWRWIVGLLIFASGLYFIIGGAKLATLGGTGYYLMGGALMCLSAVQLIRKNTDNMVSYGVFFVMTLIWAFYEAGWDFWALFSRLMVPAGFLMLLLFTQPTLRQKLGKKTFKTPFIASGIAVLVAMVVALSQMLVPHPTVEMAGAGFTPTPVEKGKEQKNWQNYGQDAGGSRFVALDQINRDNVKNLKEVWRYRTGDFTTGSGNNAEDQMTPLQVGNTLYLCTPHNNVIALEADTGKEIWKAEVNSHADAWERCRGVAYFDAKAPIKQPTMANASPIATPKDTTCTPRVYTNTPDARLIAFNAKTGEKCSDFGDNGTVDLLKGLGHDTKAPKFEVTSAPTVAGDLLVIGSRIADNVKTDMPSGVIRAYDAVTGELRWVFNARSPDPNRMLKDGEIYERGGANAWAAFSYDPEMNVVFLPMGMSAVDLWGGNRTALDEKYNTTVLALDASNGKEFWRYQTVHHDLWDFDLPMQPSLVDFPMENGENKKAVVIGTKAGQIFVLDRMTGKPLTEVVEQPVKGGGLPDEKYALTQPRSVGMPQIGAQTLKEEDMWGATIYDQLACRVSFKSMRYDGLYTAPGSDLSLSFPGSLGGMNWGSIAFDPTHQYMFVNDMRLGLWVQLFKQTEEDLKAAEANGGEKVNVGMGAVPLGGTPYKVNKNRFMSPLGIPCQEPPFGTMTAVDLKTRQIARQIPMGSVEDVRLFGIKMRMPAQIGMPTIGGPMATQGGLLFFAATQDYYLRAIDTGNGKELWKGRLPVGSQATPISYVSPNNGKQYVVITAGGARQSLDHGDYVIAYALD